MISTTKIQKMKDHWCVTVEMNGEQLITIETSSLYGKSSFTEQEQDCIRNAARHLLAFIGGDQRETMG